MRRSPLAFVLALAVSASAQNAYLVKDINTTVASDAYSSSPASFFRHGSRIYFAAGTNQQGLELFSTDGTEAGTTLVADIAPGTESSFPRFFASVNGTLVFNARNSRGEELWMSDGTAAGTRLMADIEPLGSSGPGDRIVVNGKMLFAAGESVNGRELWITDGTPAGTRFLEDLVPGAESSSPRSFVMLNGTVYFGAENGLWKTDGTETGTVPVKSGISAAGLVVAGSRIFFHGRDAEAGSEPWVSDGTEAGTHRVADIRPGASGSASFSLLFALGDRLFFAADDGIHGPEPWISDGTDAGTHMLADIQSGPNGGLSYIWSIALLGNRAIFTGQRGDQGYDLWITDGTTAGTAMLHDFTTSHGSAGSVVAAGDRVYFTAGGADAANIWVTDGTTAGTRPVTHRESGFSIGGPLTYIDGTLYLSAANLLNGYEPWKSDGTDAGTSMLKNINGDPAPSAAPGAFRAAGDLLYFAAWDGTSGSAARSTFWRTNGTPEGTVELSDLLPGDSTFSVGRRLYFRNSDDGLLWTTDGALGDMQTATEFENRFPEYPSFRFQLGNTLLIQSDEKLYATTTDFGAPAVDLGVHEGTYAFAELAGRALFFMDNPGLTTPLWITDGTTGGTHVVRTLEDESYTGIVTMGGHGYFAVGNNNPTLWRTDGTPAGTVAVTTIPGFASAVAAGNHLFFVVGNELWVSDGTATGTHELPPNLTGNPRLAAIGNSVVFAASSVASGNEPWISDGTSEGTHVLLDIEPGEGGSSTQSVTAAGAVVYFNAYTKDTGSELWMTDGTAAGTHLASDVEPGVLSSYPGFFTRAGERLYFTAHTSATGSELWAIALPSTPRLSMRDVRAVESGVVRFTATLHAPSTQTVTVEYATSDGTASATSDYDAMTGTLTFAPGETSKSFDVPVRSDSTAEGNETFLVTLRNAAGAAIETPVAVAIIEDDDRVADVALTVDLTDASAAIVDLTNRGPAIASNLRVTMTAVPVTYEPSDCWQCPLTQLAPNESMRALAYGEFGKQQYLTATASTLERDPDASNNTLAWTTREVLAMDALNLTPGANANLWLRLNIANTYDIISSDPNVVSVPPTVTNVQSFPVHGVQTGRAKITVSFAGQPLGTIDIDVLAPGAKMRYPNATWFFPDYYSIPFGDLASLHSFGIASAPFTGARPTGTVRVTSNGLELARTTLLGDGARMDLRFRLPSVGTIPIVIAYDGDENFLPVSVPYELVSQKGLVAIHATATRSGANVIVRARVSGSPAAAPTGSVRAGGVFVPLTPIGPGLSEAELTLPAGDGTTIHVDYFGDDNYGQWGAVVAISDPRRRSTRH